MNQLMVRRHPWLWMFVSIFMPKRSGSRKDSNEAPDRLANRRHEDFEGMDCSSRIVDEFIDFRSSSLTPVVRFAILGETPALPAR